MMDWEPPIDNNWDRLVAGLLLLFCLVTFALAALHIGRFVWTAIEYTEDNRAIAECYKWAEHAHSTPAFYLTDAQQAQCDYHNIDIWKLSDR